MPHRRPSGKPAPDEGPPKAKDQKMVDFSKLLAKKTSEVKRPPTLPAGLYPGVIKGYKFGESAKKKTPFVQFQVALTGWPEETDDEDRFHDGKPIDLSKKNMGSDFYLSDEALFILSEFLTALFPGDERGMEELVPAAVGSYVLADVSNRLNEERGDFFNRIEKIAPAKD